MGKIGKYYSEARGIAQQRKNPWNFVLVVFSGSSEFFVGKFKRSPDAISSLKT